jgi:D-glycero-alpha-D-manno-heptose-7-phosphate kinase
MSTIARAPVRLGFGGGGTDLPAYYERHGGFVVSAAIGRYAMAVASPSPDGGIGVNSADYRDWLRWSPGVFPESGEPLSLPRAVLGWFLEQGFLTDGVDLFLASEVPPGSGLGSSSAMTVAIVRALAEFVGTRCPSRRSPTSQAGSRSSGSGGRSASRTTTPRRLAASTRSHSRNRA